MAGFRSYFPTGALQPGDLAELDAAESRHLLKALRARLGDEVTLFDAQGGAWAGRLEKAARTASIRIEAPLPPAKPSTKVHLAIAMLKGKAMDAVLRSAVELGVASVIPLETERTEVKLSADRTENKLAHWRTVVVESMKQSGNLAGIHIPAPLPLRDWLENGDLGPAKLVASLEPDAKPLLTALPPTSTEAVLLIGPEGDFSPTEYEHIAKSDFQAVHLGDHVLRAETAAACGMSILQAVFHARD